MNQKYSKNLSMRQNRLLEKVNKLQARIQKKLDNSQFVKLAKRKQQLETKYYYENYLKHWSIALASIIVLFLSPIVVQAQNALDFDGTNDYVNFGDVDALDGLSAVTLECWVKLNSTSGRIIIKEVNGSPTDGWGFKTTSSGQIIGFARNGVDAAGVTPFNSISAGVWTHIAYVFDGSGSSNLERLKIYINGIEQTLTYAGTIPSTLSSNSSNFVFGSTSDLTTDFFNGTLDEVRIWTTARTEADILNNKNCELVGNESGLFGYYDFNQGTAGGSNSGTTTLTDLTSNGNNGALGNFALTGSTSNWVANTITVSSGGVTIVSDDADNSIISGTSVTFTATPTNGGNTPSYQWKKNGVNVGTDSDTYIDAALVDNDVIRVEMTSSITCVAVATSSDITMSVTIIQNALNLDGTNDYVNFGDVNALDGLSAVTLECWIKTDVIGGYQRIIAKEVNSSSTNAWGITITPSGQIAGFTRNGANTLGLTSANSISAGVWTHLAYVFDGSGSSNLERLKIYIDGVEQTLTYSGTIPASLPSNSSRFAFGSRSTLTGDFFNGALDEVRIWTTARTETDIVNHKNCELVGNESGLFGYYNFNQGTAGGSNSGTTTLTDLTSNGNNGTLGNFALTGSTSNWVANTITPPPALSVTIVSDDADNSIVSGTSVTFTATPTNGGSTPFYQWKKNGVNVGTDSDTYTDAALVDNDVITVEMTNEITCAAVAISSDITMTVSPVLPVELTSFTATVQDNQTNLLQWQTATEENNEGFEVERSAEGSNWEKLGFVQGQGTTLETQNYTFVDEEPTRGINYYRLKQMDFDGQFEYSNIRSVVFGSSDDKIMAIYPNPVQNELTISEGVGMITIFNALGQPIRQLNNDETLTIINTTDLPKGIYILQVQKTNGAIITQQFVK